MTLDIVNALFIVSAFYVIPVALETYWEWRRNRE
jgi:hypothetical protein